jgi:hypothetical protein
MMEQQFSGRGMTLKQEKPAFLLTLNILGKTVELHLALLMTSSHRLLIIHSPQAPNWCFLWGFFFGGTGV